MRAAIHALLALLLLACGLSGARAAAPAIGGGVWHSAALGADGVVRTWGDDSYGELGIGRPLVFSSPAVVPGATGIRMIAAGSRHVLALKSDGTVLAWGQNQNGELGDGTTDNRSTPVPVPGLSGVSAVSAGNGHSAALKSDGSVWIWGGYLGSTPLRVAGIDDVAEISCGGAFTLARRRDGTVWAWGENESGQLGDGTLSEPYVFRSTPRAVAGLSGVAQVSGGARHGVARLVDGTVRSWGSNEAGTLGDGTIVNRPTPVAVSGLAGVVFISAGALKTIAIRNDGSVFAWGNGYYALGNGAGGDFPTPVALNGLGGSVAIAAGFLHSFALSSGGTLSAWGSNDYGQLGDGTTQGRPTPSPVTSISGVSAIAVGSAFTVALKSDGSVYAWGDNTFGQLGNSALVFRSTPSAVALTGVERLAVGSFHVVALKSDGSLWAWGDSRAGQIGDGTSVNRSSPVAVRGLGAGSGITDVSSGEMHNLALRSDGSVFSWGDNYSNALGDRESTDGSVPSRITGLAGVAAVAAGKWGFSVALKSDGTVWTWGHNYNGQLGDGTRSALYGGRSTPMAVPGLSGVRAIAAGRGHVLALKTDGTLWGWGGNYAGQLGDGTLVDRLAPVRVAAGLDNIVAISAGAFHSLALKGDGTVWAWGEGWAGERSAPEQVAGLTGIAAISASNHSLAIGGDGSVWAWGGNASGQLGDGTLVDRNFPAVVLREGGAGSVAGNDWFLDLNPAVANSIPADRIPVFLVVAAGTANSVTASIKPRAQDVGVASNVYVFALAPATQIRGASLKASPLGLYAKSTLGTMDDPVPCVLAQLNASGQLAQVSSSSLQAYASNVLSAQGQTVTVLNAASTANAAGATFFVGYGASSSAMVASGTNRSVVSVPGSVECVPQAPQTGWWWNPAEGGRGFSIETVANRLFMAAFLYDPGGRASWYVTSGNTTFDGSLFNGELLTCSGGQSLGGTYPGFPSCTSGGAVTLAFNTAARGTLVWPGGTVPIERMNLVPGGLAAPTQANQPESGWWWNPAESGRGFFIEWQNGYADLAGYLYDEAGNPIWLISVFPTPDARVFSGNWWQYANGQSLTGAYKPATRINDNVAPVTVQFTSRESATMTLPGGKQIPLVRFRF